MFAKNCLQTLQLEILVDNLAKVMEVNAQDLLPLATQHGVARRIWPRSLEFIVRYRYCGILIRPQIRHFIVILADSYMGLSLFLLFKYINEIMIQKVK